MQLLWLKWNWVILLILAITVVMVQMICNVDSYLYNQLAQYDSAVFFMCGKALMNGMIPLYKMNYANDFVLRASIPSLFVLFALWTKWSMAHYHQQKLSILAICLICSLGSLHLIGFNAFRTIHQGMPDTYYEDERFSSVDNAKLAILGKSQFYAQDYENTFFWKYLAKKN